jgi:hypothetical protein
MIFESPYLKATASELKFITSSKHAQRTIDSLDIINSPNVGEGRFSEVRYAEVLYSWFPYVQLGASWPLYT